jgi:inosine-uridine nucleoside N-ribohydrolase
MPTFNLNGDRPNGENFLNADIERRQMVGKNVCHTVLFDAPRFATFKSNGHPGADLFLEAGHLYFAKHTEKKFHDPTAACLHLHPEVATWFRGKTYK